MVCTEELPTPYAALRNGTAEHHDPLADPGSPGVGVGVTDSEAGRTLTLFLLAK